jgi:hypothetical protein
MSARTTLATLDGQAPGQRLVVSLVQRADGRLTVDLREQHHAAGIGWFDQATLQLDPRQLRQLNDVLGPRSVALDQALRCADAEADEIVAIPFPGPSDRGPTRATGSDG